VFMRDRILREDLREGEIDCDEVKVGTYLRACEIVHVIWGEERRSESRKCHLSACFTTTESRAT